MQQIYLKLNSVYHHPVIRCVKYKIVHKWMKYYKNERNMMFYVTCFTAGIRG